MYMSVHFFLQVLYLMDKFNASDTFYHELSTILPSTPRSYKIKKVRTEMNVHLRRKIHRVPEPHNGVYCSVNETLSDTIEELVSTCTITLVYPNKFCTPKKKDSQSTRTTQWSILQCE